LEKNTSAIVGILLVDGVKGIANGHSVCLKMSSKRCSLIGNEPDIVVVSLLWNDRHQAL
jgi:hypothetical protein